MALSKLKQIAHETNLAEATVSRILRNRDQCSEQTRQRVREVARQMRYRPNLLVRAIQTGRTQTVGVMVVVADDFFGQIVTGIHHELIEADHVPLLACCGSPKYPLATTELEQIHRLVDRRVDALIMWPTEETVPDTYLREVWEREIPLVAVDRELEQTHADFVGTDDEAGAIEAARYLLSLGHRRIGHVAGPQTVSPGRIRRRTFEKAVADAGASCMTIEDPSFSSGYEASAALLKSPDRPTAVFAGSDRLARGFYRAAGELGLRIPQDVSVVGFADLPLATLMQPELTTLRQEPYQIGRRAARIALDRIEGVPDLPSPLKIRLKPDLIVRGSAASV